MHSSLIGKVEKANRYARELDRITIDRLSLTFRGDNDTHHVSLDAGQWHCTCHYFESWSSCVHLLTLQKIYRGHAARGGTGLDLRGAGADARLTPGRHDRPKNRSRTARGPTPRAVRLLAGSRLIRGACYARPTNRIRRLVAKPVQLRHSPATVIDALASSVRSPALRTNAHLREKGQARCDRPARPLLRPAKRGVRNSRDPSRSTHAALETPVEPLPTARRTRRLRLSAALALTVALLAACSGGASQAPTIPPDATGSVAPAATGTPAPSRRRRPLRSR